MSALETFALDHTSGLPVWIQIKNRIAYLIGSGAYGPGDRLPTVRALAVDLDMMMNVLAAGMEIPDEQLKALRGRCIQDVKKTSGSISLDDAVRYQRGSL